MTNNEPIGVELNLSFFPWLTPNTPDLGCFVRHDHDLEVDPPAQNVHFEVAPLEGGEFLPHQVYFRVQCGKAAFFQRCAIYRRDFFGLPSDSEPPDFVLGGDFRPRPSDWLKYAPQSGLAVYFFQGHHRNPANADWVPEAAVGHSLDIYENGTLSTVHYNDTGGDHDFNDLILEIAVVRRSLWVFRPAVGQSEVNAALAKNWLAKVRESFPKSSYSG